MKFVDLYSFPSWTGLLKGGKNEILFKSTFLNYKGVEVFSFAERRAGIDCMGLIGIVFLFYA